MIMTRFFTVFVLNHYNQIPEKYAFENMLYCTVETENVLDIVFLS